MNEGQHVKFPGGEGHVIGVHHGGFQVVDMKGARHVFTEADAATMDVIADPRDADHLAEIRADIVERERQVREGK